MRCHGQLTALLLVMHAAAASARAEGPRVRYGPGREIARLANRAVVESSGIAASRVNPGVFWTHNDSGGRARVFAFDREGRDLGTFTLEGGPGRRRVRAVDWEDMASFAVGSGKDARGVLVIADVGDNRRRRDHVRIHFAEEPRLGPAAAGRAPPATGSIRVTRTVQFTYDGGAVDCESVAIEPPSRSPRAEWKVYLVSKPRGFTSTVYELTVRTDDPVPMQYTARAVAELPVPMPTGLDISPDGRRAVVLTYLNAVEFTRRPGETWPAAFSRAPRAISMPVRVQGEAICYGADGATLYLTSELGRDRARRTPLYEVPVLAGSGSRSEEAE